MKKTVSVFIVCKDECFARMLELELLAVGYDIKSSLQNADAVILDLDSAENGFCEKLFAKKLPIIAFSRESQNNVGESFVFLRRPFLISELIDTLSSIFDEKTDGESNKSRGTLSVKVEANGSVKINGESIALSDTEYALLCLLLEKNGEPLSKKEAMEKIWKGKNPDSNIYDVYIHYLREKIDERFNVKFIKTVREKGYQINIR